MEKQALKVKYYSSIIFQLAVCYGHDGMARTAITVHVKCFLSVFMNPVNRKSFFYDFW